MELTRIFFLSVSYQFFIFLNLHTSVESLMTKSADKYHQTRQLKGVLQEAKKTLEILFKSSPVITEKNIKRNIRSIAKDSSEKYSSSALNSDVSSDELTTTQPEEVTAQPESTVSKNILNKAGKNVVTVRKSFDKSEDQSREVTKKYKTAEAVAKNEEVLVKKNYEIAKALNKNEDCNCLCDKETNNCKEKQLLRRKMQTRKKSSKKLNLSQEDYSDYDVDDDENKNKKNYYEEKINQHKNKAIVKTKFDSSSLTVDTDDSSKVKTQYHSSKGAHTKNSERINYTSNKKKVERKERVDKNLQRNYGNDYYDDDDDDNNSQEGQDDDDSEQSLSSNEASYEREKKRRVTKKKISVDTDESIESQKNKKKKKVQQHKKPGHQKDEDDDENCIKVYHLRIPSSQKCCTKNHHQHGNRHSTGKFNGEETSVENDYLTESNSGYKYIIPADDYPVNICDHCRKEIENEKSRNELRCDSCGSRIKK